MYVYCSYKYVINLTCNMKQNRQHSKVMVNVLHCNESETGQDKFS